MQIIAEKLLTVTAKEKMQPKGRRNVWEPIQF